MSDAPLWSERKGGSFPLTREGFHALMEDALKKLRRDRLFEERLGLVDGKLPGLPIWLKPRSGAVEFFTYRLGDPWAVRVFESPDWIGFRSDDDIFDLLELAYREIVSLPEPDGYRRSDGRRIFRGLVNPILARRDPPLELTVDGTIVQSGPEPMRRLVETPLPADTPKREVADRVDDAIAHYRRRGGTTGDRRAAVRELADVLEFLRVDVKEHMLRRDEADLFRLANEFALRHNKPTTRRDFEEPVWLAWMFYVYLATIRLVLELKRRSE